MLQRVVMLRSVCGPASVAAMPGCVPAALLFIIPATGKAMLRSCVRYEGLIADREKPAYRSERRAGEVVVRLTIRIVTGRIPESDRRPATIEPSDHRVVISWHVFHSVDDGGWAAKDYRVRTSSRG